MKKVTLLFEKSLEFQWEVPGAPGGHGSEIFSLLSRFYDLQLIIFCNPTMPEDVAYGNYFHSWLKANGIHRESLRHAATHCHRLSARIYPVQTTLGTWVELSVELFKSGDRKPFSKILMQLSKDRKLDEIRVQNYY